ncbi:GtrA family protein [Pseudonocardia spinosispora]|uniref:GtrA family protein n=1 Tax=Pseudonocardia spinosispora TaxID=103441 RepID=UPI00042458B2|nr:GtrA family protein [Pseudonocardia spinosispora]
MSTPLPLPVPLSRPLTAPRPVRRPVNRRLLEQLGSYAVIGMLSTALQLGMYLLLRDMLGPLSANLVASALSSVLNVAANRYFTFGIHNRRDLGRHHLQGLLVFVLSLGLTSCALGLLDIVAPDASQSSELVILLAANTMSTMARFSLLRGWVFATRAGRPRTR